MREEDIVLKAIHRLVKGDPSPVHLPLSPDTISVMSGMSLERVISCCKVLECHGYLTSCNLSNFTSYYITKAGISELKNGSLKLSTYHLLPASYKRA
ncbi:hypothetical protein TH61_12215 [Rufibacter sp. DG15C]|uniref:hypothetical protein n=1 Tax=Rufibacter sp. DG15C TaxID=1379909 RepID=UPI00078E2F62|nr:hypothetical protein [Rufibacter sp. DG15C]AMM51790.1 hypothetical protein TH61_12215 [Rufibacter sp. DG15C]